MTPPKNLTADESAERVRVGATLRELRERDGWKLGDFAGELNISYAYLSNIEAGRKPLPNHLLHKVCKLLGCRPIAIKHPTVALKDAG
ncbi:helix-turn-helix transcriptional regulator [Nocardioides sp. 31GB23]|uniref:helix-turn-helix domain-containing protein n=1 Tax=Nocardioides sp. 31GB23 TaxID=3156065 RepID=UPI0032AFEFC3